MSRSVLATGLLVCAVAAVPPHHDPSSCAPGADLPQTAPTDEPGRPLAFEVNRGQTDACVRYLARTPGGMFFVTPQETVLRLPDGVVRSRFVGADPDPIVEADRRLGARANYFLGSDPSKWLADVPTFGRVRCRDVYPGIDVVWYGRDGRIEYDLVVAPGADADAVEIAFEGVDRREIDRAGDLVLSVGPHEVIQKRPVVYQDSERGREVVASRYVLDGDRVRFALGAFDASRPLVIDPQLAYGTFLGGNGNEVPRKIVRDALGNSFICGMTTSTDFPVPGAVQATNHGRYDAFVTKIEPSGNAIVFSTYMGGLEDDDFWSVALDSTGDLCLAGDSWSSDFPTLNALQANTKGMDEAIVVKLRGGGSSLAFSTYLGSEFNDVARAIAVDASDAIYVATDALVGFPTTPGAFQTTTKGNGDVNVAKIKPDGSALLYSTFVGGTFDDRPLGIAVDALGDAFVVGNTNSDDFPKLLAYQPTRAGFDGFVFGVNSTGSGLLFSTYLGGSGQDGVGSVAVGPDGHVYVAGVVNGTGLTTTAPLQAPGGSLDALFAEFTSTGTAVHVGPLGGAGDDSAQALVVDPAGRVWLAGYTTSTNFPAVGLPRPPIVGSLDVFFVRLDSTHAGLEYATTLGGTFSDLLSSMAVDVDGTAYGIGQTSSADFPVTVGALQTTKAVGNDGFLVTAPVPPVVNSYFLPRTVVAHESASDPSKSTFLCVGVFDVGDAPVDLTHAATLTCGGLVVPVPAFTRIGKRFRHMADGLLFEIVPDARGSSRAKFKLSRVGDLAGVVPQEGDLLIRFSNDVVDDARCDVTLSGGRFRIAHARGALAEPNLFVHRAKAKLAGDGKDSLYLVAGLANDGTTPAQASDVTIGFGALTATIPADQFVKSGERFVFKGDVGGVVSVTLDYGRSTITVKAKNADLGDFAEGGNSTTITVGVGADSHAVSVRTARQGARLVY
jgi:hypothetical protein